MEVHPPEHAIHTWRDFFIHIGTIVVGLLIAIGLEQTVERLHHLHQMHQARERIHDELRVNHQIVQRNQQRMVAMIANLDRNMQELRLLEGKPHQQLPSLTYAWDLQLLYKAGYERAAETSALAFLPYDESAMYADTYSGVDITSKEITDLVYGLNTARAAMRGRSVSELSPAEVDATLSATALAREQALLLRIMLDVYAKEIEASLAGNYRTDFDAQTH
ncbi:MAG: hypothetical protein PW792_05765 [Acidobacteriaceae bacterium]|nr:hypothetical protein [Acidobacteriaceae bacterium]